MTPSIEPDQVLVRYGEIGLKSPGVRRHLEMLLHKHLSFMLSDREIEITKITRERGRFFIQSPDPKTCAEAAARVFGVVSTSPVWTVAAKPKKITELVAKLAPNIIGKGQTFAVRARRVKTHAFTSPEIATQVGATIIETAAAKNQPVQVDLNHPDIEINVEVRQKFAYIFVEKIMGPGGLPYGSQGSVVALHSGGLDSPVAQWLIMKRGAQVIPLYFDNDMPSQPRLRPRAIETARILSEWIPEKEVDLHIIPNYDILSQLQLSKFPKLTCILCKRMMYRIAAMLAAQVKAKALVTGETLGQVASQTLSNLAILDSSITLPVFRPLIGWDKTETMALARRIGTFESSSQDVGDCFAVPQQPSIAALLGEVHAAESGLPIEEMVTAALERMEKVSLAR